MAIDAAIAFIADEKLRLAEKIIQGRDFTVVAEGMTGCAGGALGGSTQC